MNTCIQHSSMKCVEIRRATPVRLGVALAAALTALSACVVEPPAGPILSRLPPDAPGAASPAHPLTGAEKKRYDEIDKQVLRDQDAAIAADNWARYYAPYYYPAPTVYGGYVSGGYVSGGYVGGGGFGYYSPGYYPGWWW